MVLEFVKNKYNQKLIIEGSDFHPLLWGVYFIEILCPRMIFEYM